MIKSMETAFLFKIMVISIQENLKTIKETVKVLLPGQTDINTSEILKMGKSTVSVYSLSQMEINILVNLNMIKETEKAL
jgi:hypothetical protein